MSKANKTSKTAQKATRQRLEVGKENVVKAGFIFDLIAQVSTRNYATYLHTLKNADALNRTGFIEYDSQE